MTGIVLGSIAAVVIIAGALYYFQKNQRNKRLRRLHPSGGSSFSSLGPDIEGYGQEFEDIAEYELNEVAPKLSRKKSEMTQLAEQMDRMHM